MNAIGNFISGNSGAISGLLGTGAQLYGQQNAGEALTQAANAGAATQQQYLSTAGAYYNPYLTAGAGAETALGTALGTNGQPADYSGFENMPGYQFAVQQGTQAIQRQAAAGGSAYTPNTLASVGQYVTGTAMQDYNTYIQQLQQQAGIGATAAGQIGNLTFNTGSNISQLQENAGQAQAGLYTGMGQTVGGALGAGSPYGSGVYGATGSTSGVGGLVSGGLKALGGWLGGGSSDASNYGLGPVNTNYSNPLPQSTNYGVGNYTNANGFEDLSQLPTDYSGYDGGFS